MPMEPAAGGGAVHSEMRRDLLLRVSVLDVRLAALATFSAVLAMEPSGGRCSKCTLRGIPSRCRDEVRGTSPNRAMCPPATRTRRDT